jgi:hypothetical protein
LRPGTKIHEQYGWTRVVRVVPGFRGRVRGFAGTGKEKHRVWACTRQ